MLSIEYYLTSSFSLLDNCCLASHFYWEVSLLLVWLLLLWGSCGFSKSHSSSWLPLRFCHQWSYSFILMCLYVFSFFVKKCINLFLVFFFPLLRVHSALWICALMSLTSFKTIYYLQVLLLFHSLFPFCVSNNIYIRLFTMIYI